MGLIIFSERKVVPKGLDPNNKINLHKLKEYFFEDDWDNLKLLEKAAKIELDSPTIFYPGCGVDILFPLMYTQALFTSTSIKLILLEQEDTWGTIKTVLDDVGICFKEENDKELSFYFEQKLIKVEFIQDTVEHKLNSLPSYNVYFERAFRIMRDKILDYEEKIYEKLESGGVLISDSGFENLPLEYVDISPELSTYKEMVMGVKKK